MPFDRAGAIKALTNPTFPPEGVAQLQRAIQFYDRIGTTPLQTPPRNLVTNPDPKKTGPLSPKPPTLG